MALRPLVAAFLLIATFTPCSARIAKDYALDVVALAEVNTVLDSSGQLRFTQIIYRDQYGVIRDWRMYRGQEMLPPGGAGVVIWNDDGIWRAVNIQRVTRSVTNYDPEIEDRKHNPPHKRRKLQGGIGRCQ
jgi:hypothetical protein